VETSYGGRRDRRRGGGRGPHDTPHALGVPRENPRHYSRIVILIQTGLDDDPPLT
jgi:hypothetical protein